MLLFFFVWSGIDRVFFGFFNIFFFFFRHLFFCVFCVVVEKKISRRIFCLCNNTQNNTPLVNCNNSIEFYISIAKKSSDPPKSR